MPSRPRVRSGRSRVIAGRAAPGRRALWPSARPLTVLGRASTVVPPARLPTVGVTALLAAFLLAAALPISTGFGTLEPGAARTGTLEPGARRSVGATGTGLTSAIPAAGPVTTVRPGAAGRATVRTGAVSFGPPVTVPFTPVVTIRAFPWLCALAPVRYAVPALAVRTTALSGTVAAPVISPLAGGPATTVVAVLIAVPSVPVTRRRGPPLPVVGTGFARTLLPGAIMAPRCRVRPGPVSAAPRSVTATG